jgi:hypothetical protein
MTVREKSVHPLEDQVREALRRLAETPGAIMVKVEPFAHVVAPLRHEQWARTLDVSALPERVEVPAEADRVRLTAYGAFEPTRPTDTPQTLLAELNHERKMSGVDALPRRTDVKSLGFDDLGFLSYQICVDVTVAPAAIEQRQPLCGAA